MSQPRPKPASARKAVVIDPEKLPHHYEAPAAEARWHRAWQERGIYRYDPARQRDETFVVDTPPPTVSGSLHIGHVLSFTHTDICVRYKRMRGKNIYYPMGWDDNGLPTERRVQNYFHVTCDANLPYETGLTLAQATAEQRKTPARAVSRRNFIELCHALTGEDEKVYQAVWERTGLSVDWNEQYATIDDRCRSLAQASFLDLYRRGHAYNRVSPTMWDVDFRTAVAQAEVEDRVTAGAFHRIVFGVRGTDRTFTIATTRPELLAACVGVTAHPSDPRYRDLFGKEAVTPLFHAPVRIFPSELAEPEKGTGILMVCTFGDSVDVEWWNAEKLPLRQIVGLDGRLMPVTFGAGVWESLKPEVANAAYDRIAGRNLNAARKETVQMLREGTPPALAGEPQPMEHPVRYYEKGDRPLELIPTRQWFIRLMDKKEMLLEKGRQVSWHPAHMGVRFANWTENLQLDWCVSRQRFFGVAFPVWFRLDAKGQPDYNHPILADEKSLPVDPMTDLPPGFSGTQRNKPGGFMGEKDVFDTWFTSSLTPQIGSHWLSDPARHARLFPADIRPQAHDIIRTWAFYTIVKAALHEDTIPWRHALISGFVVDPDRKKMSKSKGNVVTPMEYFEKYTADGVRYWSGGARLGLDAMFDEGVMKNGRRLVVKIYNAAKFVLSLGAAPGAVTEPLDRAFLFRLRELARRATTQYEEFEFALVETEDFFWHSFTDTFIELVKNRAKDGSAAAAGSAVTALRSGLEVLLKLFAPVLPYITEEVWSWAFAEETGVPSIHISPWPADGDFADVELPRNAACFDAAVAALSEINKAKTLAGVSLGRGITSVVIAGKPEVVALLEPVAADVMASGRVARWTLRGDAAAEGFRTEDVVFAEAPQT